MQETQQYNVNRTFSHDSVTVGARSGYANMLPREKARLLCREVVWWHHALGSPVTIEDVFSKQRAKWVSAVRADCIRRIRETLGWSYPKLGKFFGMDHSTCLHHVHTKSVATIRSTLTKENARHMLSRLRAKLIAENPQEWAVIPSQPKYSVSSNGLVRFDAKNNIRTFQLSTTGYAFITFSCGPSGKPVFWPVHKLVMEAFVGPRPDGAQVCHADGNRLNNRLSNLRYGSAKENAADRDWHGMTCRGVRNGNAKIKDQETIDTIRRRYAEGGVTQYELADEFQVSQAQINNIVLMKHHKPERIAANEVQPTQPVL